MTILDYDNSKKLLTSTGKFCINLGLERITAILELLGNPHKYLKFVHVAGTNGKGSVCAITAEILRQSGFKVGLYTSPHLFEYTERFKINGEEISKSDFSNYVFQVEQLDQAYNLKLTEFEILTAVAFKYFYDNKTDIVILETGLGGRFDATNVIEKPIVSVITSISIDHKDRLGDTVEKIAFEKAGIIKTHSTVVINSENKGFSVIKKVAGDMNCNLETACKTVDIAFEDGINYAIFNSKRYEFALWGLHQKQNLTMVIKILDILSENGFVITENAIKTGLKQVVLPARFQYKKEKNMVIDGAHNEDAALCLRANLDFYFPQSERAWIYGTLNTKEYGKVVNILFRSGDEVHLTRFNNKLSVEPNEILRNIAKFKQITYKNNSKTANTLNYFSKNRLIIVTGSFYMIGELLYMP